MNYSSKSTHPAKHSKAKTISFWFTSEENLHNALVVLSNQGYTKDELIVHAEAELSVKSRIDAQEDSDKTLVYKALRGLKFGATASSLILSLATAFMIQFHPQLLQSRPLMSILFALIIGAVWGGTIGFLIGPLLPLYQSTTVELRRFKGQKLLSFTPKNHRDELFFKSLSWPLSALNF